MKVIIAGDFCQKYRVDEAIKKRRYGDLFDEIKPIINNADYSIVNFEFPIIIDPTNAKPILKCGPNLHGTIEAVDAIKYAGFNCCTLANNHILDQGEQCCLDTKNELEKASIDTVGVGYNLEDAATILYKEIRGETLAIINCCEHEFSIATDTTTGANPLNPIQQYYRIQEARGKADYVLVIVHGGHEHCQLPSPEMQEIYRFFVDSGADAVVNHHQHCYCGYEEYHEKPIFYGLGNLCFDNISKRNDIWNEGYMVSIDFEKSHKPLYMLFPYIQCSSDCFLKLDLRSERFKEKINGLNSIIANKFVLQEKWNKYEKEHIVRYNRVMHPLSSKWLVFLEKIHFLTVSKSYYLYLCAVIQCESHRSSLLSFLRNKLK